MTDLFVFNGAARAPFPWGKWLLIGLGAVVSLLLLVVPLISIFATALAEGLAAVGRNLNDSDMLHAI